ncbi:MAG TPA: group II truncated hemoglobin [Rhodoferax sp.]
MNIEKKLVADTLFDQIGGEPKVQALVERFYDLMDLEPGYQAVRAEHGNVLDDARQRLFLFLCGWLGGPQHYVERFGHPHLRRRHQPFKIGLLERDQWVACMDQAMGEIGVADALRSQLREAFFKTADSMCNQSEIERL